MNRKFYFTSLLVALASLFVATGASAQEPAKGPKKKPGTEEAAPPGPAPVELFRAESEAIQTILDSKPKTPAQLFHAADVLASLGRPDLGKIYLRKILADKPNQDALASIDKEFGSAAVLRIAQAKELSPEGGQVGDAILNAISARSQDPKRLTQQIARLGDPSPVVRVDAMKELRTARLAAVAPLISALANPKQAKLHSEIKTALVELDLQIVEPLLGVLESDDIALKTHVIEVLGRLGAESAMPSILVPLVSPKSSPELRAAAESALVALYHKAPNKSEVEQILRRQTVEYFNRQRPLKTDPDGKIELWHWDAQKKESVAAMYFADEANVAIAGRLAQGLHELFPQNEQYRRWYLTGILDAASYRAGLDKPVAKGAETPYEIVKQLPAKEVEDILEFAVKNDHIPAATVAARVLSETGHLEMLTARGATPCPLVAAMSHADRRLRYAAVDSVLKLDPSKPFPGSSHLPEALGYFVRSYGARQAVVGHPNAQVAIQLAALLRHQGYEATYATNGRDLFKLATSSPDVELALICSAIDRVPLQPLVQELRQDRRTALLPLGLISALDNTEPVKYLAEDDPLSEGFPNPLDDRGMQILIERLQARAGRKFVSAAERQQQAKGSLEWLAALSRKNDFRLFNVREQEPALELALTWPEIAPTAAEALGHFGTATSQRMLADLASRETAPIASREAAAKAFGESIHTYNVRLTKTEILGQYARYNSSASADRATQALLGSMLDAIESRTKKP